MGLRQISILQYVVTFSMYSRTKFCGLNGRLFDCNRGFVECIFVEFVVFTLFESVCWCIMHVFLFDENN